MQSISASSTPSTWASTHVRSEQPDATRDIASDWPRPAAGSPLRALAPAVVVQRERGPVLVGQPLEPAQQIGAARLGGERHRPRAHPPVQPAVPLLDERGGAVHRLGGRSSAAAGTARRGRCTHSPIITRMPASVVGLQARVGELGAARVHEAHRAVLRAARRCRAEWWRTPPLPSSPVCSLNTWLSGLPASSGKMPRTAWA